MAAAHGGAWSQMDEGSAPMPSVKQRWRFDSWEGGINPSWGRDKCWVEHHMSCCCSSTSGKVSGEYLCPRFCEWGEVQASLLGQERNGEYYLKGTFCLPPQHQRGLVQVLHVSDWEGKDSCFHCSFCGLSADEIQTEMSWTSTISNLPLIQRTAFSCEEEWTTERDAQRYRSICSNPGVFTS